MVNTIILKYLQRQKRVHFERRFCEFQYVTAIVPDIFLPFIDYRWDLLLKRNIHVNSINTFLDFYKRKFRFLPLIFH